MARSDIAHISMWVISGISDAKSQKVSCADPACGMAKCGSAWRVDEVGKLHRVLDEEDRDVVADQVPVALVRVELHREAAHVARGVGRAALAEDRSRSARKPASACPAR
jgi:hypothetical protein